MRLISRWARRSNEWAVDNARGAAVEASRRRVEAAEVTAYLEATRTVRVGRQVPGQAARAAR